MEKEIKNMMNYVEEYLKETEVLENEFGMYLSDNNKPVIPSLKVAELFDMDIDKVDELISNMILVFPEIKDNNTILSYKRLNKDEVEVYTYDIDLNVVLFLSRFTNYEYNEVTMKIRRAFYKYEKLLFNFKQSLK